MSRIKIYVALTLVAGLVAGVWFALTEEVVPGATEPGSYNLFLAVTVVLAMAVACGVCVLFEIARGIWILLRDNW